MENLLDVILDYLKSNPKLVTFFSLLVFNFSFGLIIFNPNGFNGITLLLIPFLFLSGVVLLIEIEVLLVLKKYK